MNRSLTLLLASLLLVFTLTACGRDTMQETTTQNGSTTTENDTTASGDDLSNSGTTDQGTAADRDSDSLIGNVGDSIVDGAEDAGDAITGYDTDRTEGTADKTASPLVGASYEQMLRNARVHDTDGYLMDYENAVTPGSAY